MKTMYELLNLIRERRALFDIIQQEISTSLLTDMLLSGSIKLMIQRV